MKLRTARLETSGFSQYVEFPASGTITNSACLIRAANIFRTGGGAYRSASPVSSSVGTVIVSSSENVMVFLSGWAAAGGPGGRLLCSSSTHRRVPSGVLAGEDGETSRPSGGI